MAKLAGCGSLTLRDYVLLVTVWEALINSTRRCLNAVTLTFCFAVFTLLGPPSPRPVQPKPMEFLPPPHPRSEKPTPIRTQAPLTWTKLAAYLLLLGAPLTWQLTVHTYRVARTLPPPLPRSRPSACLFWVFKSFSRFPQTPSGRTLMAAQGREATEAGLKNTLRGRAESSGPCYSQRQDQDLPPESAEQADWLTHVYPLTRTNHILRLSFQLLKGSVKAKQTRISQK